MRVKALLKRVYRKLPFPVAVRIARGQPDVAFNISDRSQQITINDYLGNFRVNIDTRSDIERRMLSRSYDLETLSIIRSYVKSGQTCFDIGANVGAVTLALAQQIGPTGHVDAFEPGPPFFDRLQRNIDQNPEVMSRVRLHRLGLSNTQTELLWHESQTDPGTASMHWVDPSRPDVVKVPITTLDTFVEDAGFESVDFVKIDVDGMDHLIIEGGRRTITQFQPIIYFETTLCDNEQREAARTNELWLIENGYEIYKILDKKGTVRRTRFPDLSFNTLAIPIASDSPGSEH